MIDSGITSIEDIAVDWLAHNIYWTDYHRNTIEMARVNGSSRLIIVYKNLYEPKSLVLDPAQGWVGFPYRTLSF